MDEVGCHKLPDCKTGWRPSWPLSRENTDVGTSKPVDASSWFRREFYIYNSCQMFWCEFLPFWDELYILKFAPNWFVWVPLSNVPALLSDWSDSFRNTILCNRDTPALQVSILRYQMARHQGIKKYSFWCEFSVNEFKPICIKTHILLHWCRPHIW